jgi:hypothetical protein
MHGWHRMVSIIARSIDGGEFEKLISDALAAPKCRESPAAC